MNIITGILDILSALLKLMEAEGRILQRAMVRLGWSLAFIIIASILGLAGLGFLLAGIHQYLAAQVSPAAASLYVALFTILLAVILGIFSKPRAR